MKFRRKNPLASLSDHNPKIVFSGSEAEVKTAKYTVTIRGGSITARPSQRIVGFSDDREINVALTRWQELRDLTDLLVEATLKEWCSNT